MTLIINVNPYVAFTDTQHRLAELAPRQLTTKVCLLRGLGFSFADAEVTIQVDADLAGCKGLQAIPRLVYGMLRCALLMQRPGQHPDERAALRHLWGSLPPAELRCALHPSLTSFSDPDTLVSV